MGGKTMGLRASDFQSIWKEIKDAGFILEVGGEPISKHLEKQAPDIKLV